MTSVRRSSASSAPVLVLAASSPVPTTRTRTTPVASVLRARASLDRPTADQHTPHPTCSPLVSTGHGLCVSLAPRYLILGVSCNTLVFAARPSAVERLSVTAQHAMDRLSSHPPLHSSVYLAMECVTLTHSHCYSLAVTALCLPGRLSAPRAVLLMIPNLFNFQRCQPALTCMIRTILHIHLQMSRTMDGTSRQYKHKQHCYITFLYCHQHCEHRSTFVK